MFVKMYNIKTFIFLVKNQQIYTGTNKSAFNKIYQNNLQIILYKAVYFQPIIQEFINKTNFYYQSS